MTSQNKKQETPYLLLGFWRFAILSTLMVIFFPWSLLFCWFFCGFGKTIWICAALLHDFIKILTAAFVIMLCIMFALLLFYEPLIEPFINS